MSKTIKIIISLLAILLISGAIFWSVKVRKQQKIEPAQNIVTENQGDSQDQTEQNNNTEAIDTSDWKTYENEEFGFKVKYPSDWTLAIKDDAITGDNNKGFFFKKDDHIYFAIFPTGGFGQGIAEPTITYERFKGRDVKMFRYKEYPYPSFIYIINNFPQGWGVENRIELRGSAENIKILQAMYDDFNFTE